MRVWVYSTVCGRCKCRADIAVWTFESRESGDKTWERSKYRGNLGDAANAMRWWAFVSAENDVIVEVRLVCVEGCAEYVEQACKHPTEL